MKKLIQAILMAVFMILLVIPQAVQAQEYSSEQDYYQAVQDNQRVYDFAELLSDSERENIEEKISDASEQSGLDIVVLTVNQMFGKTDREMADDFYDNGQFGFGRKRRFRNPSPHRHGKQTVIHFHGRNGNRLCNG